MSLVFGMAVQPALAEVPGWLQGSWSTNARLTAPDGAQLRIRCTLDGDGAQGGADTWSGTLGCATVQGRFEGRWDVTLAGAGTTGRVVFSGTESADLDLSGSADATRVDLASADGQGVVFTPGADGALVVEMRALGPQRLTGALTFEPR
jgi:hypothetical protein